MPPEEIDYFEGKKPGRTYFSRPFRLTTDDDQNVRFASQVLDHDMHHEFAEVKGELVIRITEGLRDEVRALFYEDAREINTLTIQRFTRETGKPHKSSISFHGEEIKKLYEFLRAIAVAPLPEGEKTRIDEDILDEILRTAGDEKLRNLLAGHPELVLEVVQNEVTTSDIVALRYRKEQLGIFERLLSNEEYFTACQEEWAASGPEKVWQAFFEKNPWIFGYGLQYVFTDRLSEQSLEQVVAGYSVAGKGKRVDALLKTLSAVSSLCFVELKRHDTPLLAGKAYRPECWPISSELTGAIAQIQKSIQKASDQIRNRIEITDKDGELTSESAFAFRPKAYIVIGDLSEFLGKHGVNEQRLGSFELFRRQLSSPEILTFDELFERARWIVEFSEAETDLAGGTKASESDAEIPQSGQAENQVEFVPF